MDALFTDEEAHGRVVAWRFDRPYGWIKLTGNATGNEEIFLHRLDCGGTPLPIGTRIRFELVETSRGLRARHVVPIDRRDDDRPFRQRRR